MAAPRSTPCWSERHDASPNRPAPAGRAAPRRSRAVTPAAFVAKWRASELKERSGAQEHFIDLCRLLGEPTPAEADPSGERYCFKRGARKDTGGEGWAGVRPPYPARRRVRT